MSKSILTQARLQELLHYDPETGVFTRLVSTNPRLKVGDIAGCIATRGYRSIMVEGKRYKSHRLAWFYVYGVWPTALIDHKNGVTGDNRIDNLREATGSQNKANQPAYITNTSGFKGVSWNKASKKWLTQIKHQGKLKHLGTFATPEEAHAAYCTAATQLNGEFANFELTPKMASVI